MKKRMRLVALVALLLVQTAVLLPLQAQSPTSTLVRTVRFGLYENPPMSFLDDGQPQGFFVDVLEAVAAEEGWQVEYVPCEWSACLQLLQQGGIDLLAPIGYSDERAERYDFNSETMISNWARIYTPPDSDIDSILDLEGKVVAVLTGDIHTTAFRAMVADFGIACKLDFVQDYPSVFSRIEEGRVDAGVVNRIFATQREHEYDVRATSILFNPIEVRYAALKGRNQDVLRAIDTRLAVWKGDETSPYHRALDRWFAGVQRWTLPTWIWWALGITAGLGALLLAGILILRAQVRARTRELQESAERLEELARIVRRSPAVAFLWRNEEGWPVEFASDSVRLFGYAPEDFYSGDLLYADIIHPEDLQRVAAEVAQHSAEGRHSFVQEYRILTKSGDVRWLDDRTWVRRDANGNVTHYEGVVLDTTARKQAEEAMREEALRNEMILQTTMDGYILADTEGQILDVNPAYCAMMGYTRDELLKMNIRQVEVQIPPEKIQERIERMVAQGTDRFETKHKAKDGSVTDLDVSIVIMQPEKVPLVAAFVRDITARKQAEEELRQHRDHLEQLVAERTRELAESESRYRQLVESPLVGVYLADKNGRFTFVNKRLAEMAGYSQEEALGKSMLDVIAPEQRQWLAARLRKRATGDMGPDTAEAEIVRKDGTRFTSLVAPAAFFDEQGNFAGYVGAMIDITERKRLEEEQRRLLNLMAGREVRMAELKEVIRLLRAQLQDAGMSPVADDPLRREE